MKTKELVKQMKDKHRKLHIEYFGENEENDISINYRNICRSDKFWAIDVTHDGGHQFYYFAKTKKFLKILDCLPKKLLNGWQHTPLYKEKKNIEWLSKNVKIRKEMFQQVFLK